jgi:hypothetical protein
LYYVDLDGGTVRRISYFAANQPPTAVATAAPRSGPAPLAVTFDGSGSSDPDSGDILTYAWDLDGDGQFDNSTAVRPTCTYTTNGSYPATLGVTEAAGARHRHPRDRRRQHAAAPRITSPAGSATDTQDGTLPANALSWEVVMHHCSANCHQHPVQSYPDVAGGTFTASDHEYPSYLELRLTATDSGGLRGTASPRLGPRTVVLSFQTNPGSMRLVVNATAGTATFSRTVIVGSSTTVPSVCRGRSGDPGVPARPDRVPAPSSSP